MSASLVGSEMCIRDRVVDPYSVESRTILLIVAIRDRAKEHRSPAQSRAEHQKFKQKQRQEQRVSSTSSASSICGMSDMSS
eukprot:3387026-Alexandrium_andersonii.AAC.1